MSRHQRAILLPCPPQQAALHCTYAVEGSGWTLKDLAIGGLRCASPPASDDQSYPCEAEITWRSELQGTTVTIYGPCGATNSCAFPELERLSRALLLALAEDRRAD